MCADRELESMLWECMVRSGAALSTTRGFVGRRSTADKALDCIVQWLLDARVMQRCPATRLSSQRCAVPTIPFTVGGMQIPAAYCTWRVCTLTSSYLKMSLPADCLRLFWWVICVVDTQRHLASTREDCIARCAVATGGVVGEVGGRYCQLRSERCNTATLCCSVVLRGSANSV